MVLHSRLLINSYSHDIFSSLHVQNYICTCMFVHAPFSNYMHMYMHMYMYMYMYMLHYVNVHVVTNLCTYVICALVPGDCSAGYFCVEGSDSRTEEICPVGHYCPTGTGEPRRCAEVQQYRRHCHLFVCPFSTRKETTCTCKCG